MIKILGSYILVGLYISSFVFGSSEVLLTMKADKSSAFVGEPIVISVIISEKVGTVVDGNRYEKPDFSGFLVQEAKNNTTTIENGFKKTQLNYLLIPKNAGIFNIKPPKADISVQNGVQSLEFMGIIMQTSSPVVRHLTTQPLTIIVKPAPKNIDLVGDFTITATTNTTQSKANKPIVLTFKIEGNGVVDDMRDFDFGIDGVTTYSNKPKISQDFSNNTLKSSYQKEYIFVSDHNFTIPSKTITIFNPRTSSTIQKVIPSQNITIFNSNPKVSCEVISEHSINENDSETLLWFSSIIGFVVGAILISFVGWILFNKSKNHKIKPSKNELLILLPYARNDSEVDEMVRNLYAKQKGNKNIKIDNKKLKKLLRKYESKIR